MMSIKLEIRVQTCGFVCLFVCYFHANFLSLHFSFNVKVTICCLMWFGSHAGRSSKRHNKIIWLHFSCPSLSSGLMCIPASVQLPWQLLPSFSFFSFSCPTCRIVGPEGFSFPFFFFFAQWKTRQPRTQAIRESVRWLLQGPSCVPVCVWCLQSWRVSHNHRVRVDSAGMCCVVCVCEFSLWVYTTIVGLGGSEFWPAHFPGAHSRR